MGTGLLYVGFGTRIKERFGSWTSSVCFVTAIVKEAVQSPFANNLVLSQTNNY